MCVPKTGPELWSLWPTVVRNGPQDRGSQETSSVQLLYGATYFACGAGDGNRTRTVSLGTVRTHGCVLGALRDSRSRAAWSVPWTPPLMAREWHGVEM
jgi:hypothetical protein